MKRICLLYNNINKSYIINEDNKLTSEGVPETNIKKGLDDVVDFIVAGYRRRNIMIITSNFTEQDYEELESSVRERLPKAELN